MGGRIVISLARRNTGYMFSRWIPTNHLRLECRRMGTQVKFHVEQEGARKGSLTKKKKKLVKLSFLDGVGGVFTLIMVLANIAGQGVTG